MRKARAPTWLTRRSAAKLALLPTAIAMIVCFYGCLAWMILISFSASKLVPDYRLVRWMNYGRLFGSLRWETAYSNLFLFGGAFVVSALALGFALAMVLDRNLRGEGWLRFIFLYPMSMSFIVTGLAWNWFLNPTFGLQSAVRALGFKGFVFDWIVDQDRAIYTIVMAATWHAAGLVMALALASFRGVDPDIWRATRIEGIHPFRVYWHIVLPMAKPALVTSVLLLTEVVVKTYDVVIAMTKGGPGGATDLPTLFIVDFSFHRASLGVAAAGAVVMLASVLAALAPFLLIARRRS